MKTETIGYKDGEITLRGYLAYDETISGKRPGILVMPEALGLGTHAKQRAERLAQLGYVALAGDPYGNGLELATVEEAIKLARSCFPIRPKRASARESRSTNSRRCHRSTRAGWRKSVFAWAAPSVSNSRATAHRFGGW